MPGTIGARRGLLVLTAAALFLLAPLPAASEWIGAYWPLWGGNSWTYRNVDPPNDLYTESVFEICIGTPCDTNQVRDWEAVDPALRSLYGLDPQYDDVVLVVTYDRDHGPNLHNIVAASNLPAGRPPPAGAVTALEWYQRGVGQIAFTDVDAESGGLHEFYKLIDTTVSVPEPEPARASVSPVLAPNWPNPFNPRTTLRFDLPAAGRVRLEVYDVRGRLVGSLVDAELPAGRHEAVWDGRDSEGRAMASGSYFARLSAGGEVETVMMGLVR